MAIKDKHYKYIARELGIEIDELKKMSPSEIDKKVESKIGKELTHSHNFANRIPRGNPFLALGRFLSKKPLSTFNRIFSN